jgi:S1-C subfamily serine protease
MRPSSVVVLGILLAVLHGVPARVIAQVPGYTLVARNKDFSASVRAASLRRDSRDTRFVSAEVRYEGDRGRFSSLTIPDASRVRIVVAVMRVDCEIREMFEQSDYYYAKDGSALGQQQYGERGLLIQVAPGSINAEVRDWICARAPAKTITTNSGQQPPSESSTAGAPGGQKPPEVIERRAGSAFAVGTTDLLTNNHVVEGCSEVTVVNSDGTSFEGRTGSRDARNDLALISVGPTRLASVARFRSNAIRTGEDVIAVGFPLSGLLATELNVSKGIVSAAAGLLNDTSQLQISAEVQPGNSGGPLLDSTGAVVGVVVSKLDAITVARLTGDIPQNINFAIKSELAKVFLQSQGVEPRTAPATASAVAISDTVEAAREYTFLVECYPIVDQQ